MYDGAHLVRLREALGAAGADLNAEILVCWTRRSACCRRSMHTVRLATPG